MPAAARSSSWTWACGCCAGRRKTGGGGEAGGGAGASGRAEEGDEWSLFMDLPVLETATDGFSDDNLLGRGGFGPVYKGVLQDGQQIAVKKLSLGSRQGVREFLNEVQLLLKVQHRNLVSLLGCCASSGHKMLVYPYFPNGSLDHILFSLFNAEFQGGVIEGVKTTQAFAHRMLAQLSRLPRARLMIAAPEDLPEEGEERD